MPTDREWKEAVFNCTVWHGGTYTGHKRPEFVPYAASTAHSVLSYAASIAARDGSPQWLAEGLAKLRDDALVLAHRISPVGMLPEPTGELGERLKEAARLHEQDKK